MTKNNNKTNGNQLADKIAGLDKKTSILEEKLELKFENADHALDLQSKEYLRRLDMLNGEGERLRSMQATYLPRETYEINHKELCNKIDELEEFKNNALGRQAILMILLSAAVSIVVVFFSRSL